MSTLFGFSTMTYMMNQNWGDRALESAQALKDTVLLLDEFLKTYWQRIEDVDSHEEVKEEARALIATKKFKLLLRNSL